MPFAGEFNEPVAVMHDDGSGVAVGPRGDRIPHLVELVSGYAKVSFRDPILKSGVGGVARPEQDADVVMRTTATIRPGMLLVLRGRSYDILGVQPSTPAFAGNRWTGLEGGDIELRIRDKNAAGV